MEPILALAVVVFAAAVVALMTTCLRATRRIHAFECRVQQDMELYRDTHPPISDSEYVKLFSPDVSAEIDETYVVPITAYEIGE